MQLTSGPHYVVESQGYVWDLDTLAFVRGQQALLRTDNLTVTLPASAATAARQDTGNTSLALALTELQSILTKLNASLAVTGSFYQATQPVSAASLPLPADAATATLQGTGNTSLGTIAAKDFATSAKQDTGNTSLGTIAGKDFATSAKQDTGNTSLGTIAGKDFSTQTTLVALLTELALKADLTETQPVSGPVTDGQLRATPLPISGAVTYAALLTELQLKADLTETQPVSYVALLTELQLKADLTETQPVSGPLTDAQLRAATVPISGTVSTAAPTSGTSAFSTASVLVTSTTVLASNANRRGATVYNESGAIVFLKLGATASLTSYTVQVPIGGSYEAPFGYTGVIDGITVAITAVVRVTEFTA